jgi:hypothetical protein
MTTDPKKYRTPLILWSLVWAFALIAAAFFFKGNPALYWIEPAILAGAITSLMWKRASRAE